VTKKDGAKRGDLAFKALYFKKKSKDKKRVRAYVSNSKSLKTQL
jgi:hypothetical protein